jgi:4-amino-4-deoxy-L-arabinose transferase-like glycosyltransferase
MHPIEGVQQVVEVLGARRGVAIGWAAAMILVPLLYLLDLGAGTIWNGDDAQVALAAQGLAQGTRSMQEAIRAVPPPSGAPLGLLELAAMFRLFGLSEAALRLLPALAALGCALCLLAIAIDVGVGRHAGGLGGLTLLAMPLTYELSHRVLPDMLIAFGATGAVALTSHSLHGHKFDRHILPHHTAEEAPPPLPLRRLPMVFAALGIGAASLLDPRAGLTAIAFAFLDVLLAHRNLLRKRRVWAALFAGSALTVICAGLHPGGLSAWLTLPAPGEMHRNIAALWRQGEGFYGRHVGQVVIVAAGFGLLLGSLRRASRPLLAWVIVAIAMTWLGDVSPPPRGLGLVLPPLALCAAVGLESPVRWLGRLGMVVTAAAFAGVVVVLYQAGPVLHRDDTIKVLTQSQRRAPPDALLCTVGLKAAGPQLYVGRPVAAFASVEEVAAALRPEQDLSCLMSPKDAAALQQLLAPPPPAPRGPRGNAQAQVSLLASVLDIEEPPPEVAGPRIVHVSR